MVRKLGIDLALSLAIVAGTSAVIGAVLSHWVIANVSLLYILGILWLAAVRGRAAALLASVEAFLLFDWFFVPPYHTLDVEHPQEWLALGTFLVVAVVAGQSHAAQRRQAVEAAERDRHTQLLYELSTELTAAENLGAIFNRMLETLATGLGLTGIRLYVWRHGARELSGVFQSVEDGLPAPANVHRVPCKIGDVELAELEIFPKISGSSLSDDDVRVLQGFANQLANGLERRRLEKEEQRSQLLAEANRTKTSLLAAVSHDLRTPLAAIKASATGLLQHGSALSESERREFLVSIDNEVNRLDHLVANLLDMSRIESGALLPHLEWHNLGEIAADVVDRLQPVSNGHNLQLLCDDREYLCQVDYVQLSQVLMNLVDNAIRHGQPGTPVRIAVADGHVSVENTGRRLTDEEREHIFDRFYRGDGRVSGTGLGLAIAKGIVDAHGGSIWAENTATGVVFHVSLSEATRGTAATDQPRTTSSVESGEASQPGTALPDISPSAG